MRFELFIAARYLRAKRRQAVVGVITAISVIGVAAGVASLIIALAITNGMRRDLQDRLVGSTAHVMLMRIAGDGIRDWRPLLSRLRALPHVTAAAPGLYEEVLISRGAKSAGALIDGIVPADQRTVSDLLQTIQQGSAEPLNPQPATSDASSRAIRSRPSSSARTSPRPSAPRSATPSSSPARRASSPRSASSPSTSASPWPASSTPASTSTTPATPSSASPTRSVSSPSPTSSPPSASRWTTCYRADAIGRQIEQAAGPGYESTNWMEQNRELFRALRLEQIVTFIILALIVCVAALNILIALTMMVMEKTRDIAVLMSFGVRADQVRRIFLLQGLLISLIGTALGLVLGFGLSWLGGHYRFIHLDASVYSIDYLPFAPRLIDALIVAAVSLGVSLLATLYPSSSAAKVLPAEALRYE